MDHMYNEEIDISTNPLYRLDDYDLEQSDEFEEEGFDDIDISEDSLMHYGTKRHSGRYPWGSGSEPYQRGRTFIGRYEELKKQGMSDREIAQELNMLNEKGEP